MGIARATLTLHRKAKDGSDGKDGKDALSFTVTPSSVAVKCKADGTLEQDTYTCAVAVMRGTTDITSSYKPRLSSYSYVQPSLNSTGKVLTLTGFRKDKNEGFVYMTVDVDGTVLKRKVTFYKVFDGAKGEQGEKGDKGDQGEQGEKGDPGKDAHTYEIRCTQPVIYLDSAGNMKSSTGKQRVQAKLYIDGVPATTGITWSVSANTGITATIGSDGWVTLSNYDKDVPVTSFIITAEKSGMPEQQKLTVQVGSVQDGVEGLKGVAGDTMLYQGEYDKTKTYRKHYQLDNSSESNPYFTDYVSYGKNGSMAQFWAVAVDSVTGVAPSSSATQWIKFSTSEYLATKLLISNQILGNIIEAVNISATSFYTQTLSAKTIDAENATFKNLTVSGYFRSGFQEIDYNYQENPADSTTKGVIHIQDQLNIMVSDGGKTQATLYMYLPNNERYVGARMLIYVPPYEQDHGTGIFIQATNNVCIETGFQWVAPRTGIPEEVQTLGEEFKWFMNTKATQTTSGGVTTYRAAKIIRVCGGFVELIGVPYVSANTTYCRWMLLNVQSPENVEYKLTE